MIAARGETPKWLRDIEVKPRRLDSLTVSPRNVRTHTDEQVEQIARSITEFGWTNPVLIDEAGEIIAGHGRVAAAKLLDQEQVPCLELRGLSEQQKRAYALADNKLALNAGWNVSLLAEELASLRDMEFDISVIGFNEAELSHLFADDDSAPPDQHSEWNDMPEFIQENQNAFRTILIHCKDAQAVADFARIIGQDIGPKTRYLWFPKAAIAVAADKRYVTSS